MPLVLVLLALAAVLRPAPASEALYFKAANDHWQPLPAKPERDTLTFTLDPARLKAGRTVLLLSPDPAVNLDDATPPRLTGLKLDDQPLPADQPAIDLDWLPALPREVVFAAQDAGNLLDRGSLNVLVDGQALAPTRLTYAPSDAFGKGARVTADLTGAFTRESVAHSLTLRLTDAAPEHNALLRTLRFHCLGRFTADPLVLVDSCYAGYEKTGVLVDGQHAVPGQTTVGVTWASLEERGDHWVVLAWPEPRALQSVRLYWAYYQATYWSARKLVAQTWDGRRFVTRWQTDSNPAAAVTALALGGVTTDRLRLIQPDGGGNPDKGPNIFWLDEIEVQ